MGVAHGVNGWQLIEFDWNLDTGIATLTYERDSGDGELETFTTTSEQPGNPDHIGWNRRRDR